MSRSCYAADCEEMDRYTFIRRTAISENEERVVQVDEKRLECEIATRSDEATHNISLLIADIYACMSDTDASCEQHP